MTKVFLAGALTHEGSWKDLKPPYLLESFYYMKDSHVPVLKERECQMFLLDSGAFTFLNQIEKKGKSVDFDQYLNDYISFINRHDIKYFFELDIDSVVGYPKVLQMRKKLEKETGKKCIPVWHKSRGIGEWKKIVKDYDYVAIGGIVTKEIKPSEHKFFTPLLEIARKENCKVHGLGFTNIKGIKKYNFYSVDSTSWIGSKFGNVYDYDTKENRPYNISDKVGRPVKRKNDKMLNRQNIIAWLKFVKFMDKKGK